MKYAQQFVDWWRKLPKEFQIPAILIMNLFAIGFVALEINKREIKRTDDAQTEIRELKNLIEVVRTNAQHREDKLQTDLNECRTSTESLILSYLRDAKKEREEALKKYDELNKKLSE